MTNSLRAGRLIGAAAGMALALGATGAVLILADAPQPRLTADCTNVETNGDFSMNCAPTVTAEPADQLTEQEVSAPGYNSQGQLESHDGNPNNSSGPNNSSAGR